MSKRAFAWTVAVMVLAILAGNAHATTYGTITFKAASEFGQTMGQMVDRYDHGTVWNGYTGSFELTVSSYDWDVLPPCGGPSIYPPAFCIETELFSLNTWYTYDVMDVSDAPIVSGPEDQDGDPMGDAKADLLKELWGRHHDDVVSNDTGSAFAQAVYEIVFEDYDDIGVLSVGEYQGSGKASVITLAEDWLDDLDGSGPKACLVSLTKSGKQDLIVEMVPQPLTMLGMFLGLGSVGAYIRRRRMR